MRALLPALFAAALAAAAPLQAAEPVQVRGGLHADFGRIVFDWPRRVGYEAAISDGRLQVTFDEAAAFEGDVLRRGLSGYGAAPRVGGDGRSFSMPLEGDLALKDFRLGNKVVLDLSRSSAAAAAEEAEAPLPQVRVRAGQHKGFSRLVFDWEGPVGNVIEEAPGRARIVFDRSADFDVAPARAVRLAEVSRIETDPQGVTLSVPEGSRSEVSRSGTKVVLDIRAPTTERPGRKEETPKIAKTTPAAPEKSGRKEAPAPVADLSPREAPAAPQRQAALPVASDADGAEEDPASEKDAAPTSILPKSMGGAAELPEIAPPVPKAARPAAKSKDAVEFSGAQKAEEKKAAPPAGSARGRFTVRTEPMPSFVASRAQGPKAEAFEPVVLTFEWDRPAAAAAFRRGENLWLVFDQPAPKDLVQQISTVAPHLGEARLLEGGGATILIIAAVPTVAPRLSREGSRWTVDLRPRSPLPEHGLAAPVVETDGEERMRYPMIGAGRMLWLTDPEAGDRLVVVPTRGAGMGLALPYSFPQFRSLQTQQGVVLQPLTPGIEVATVRSGVLVRDRDGLLVSAARERRNASRVEDPALEQPRLLDLPAWRRGGVEEFQDNRQALQNALRGLEGERLGIARLELARFYFANGFGSEALGVIQVIEDENPRLARDPEVRLMKGASQVMMQDFRVAETSLAHPALVGEREALLWQAVLAAQAEDWQAAATGFAATRDLIDDYPGNLRLDLHLAAAEAFLRSGDLEAATLQIGALLHEELDERELAQVQVVQGALNLAGGDPEAARKLWTAVRDGSHRPSQARARLALIDLGLEEGRLSPEAAVAELERLRFAWRGDFFEFTLLRKLAELYVEQNRYRDALYALREAASNFPDGPAASNAAQRMREIFAGIYHGPGDPDVPPLRALALYQEFMELTPGGPDGDRMIAGLADRLVEVDLLDRAAELLEGQVRYRLEGAEKARIGARLALIELLNRKPEASLAALDFSAAEGASQEIALQRRQLRARALAELNRSEEALELLAGDESLAAEQLRADIHWQGRDWPEAAASLSKLVPLLPPRRPLAAEESQLVVNLAVALMLSQQMVELEDLDRRYGAAMAKGPHAETFELLVGDGEGWTISSIADELGKVAKVQDFMANYRKQLRDGELSQVN